VLLCVAPAAAQMDPPPLAHIFFINCSSQQPGDGSSAHPWNSLPDAQAHPFVPGDRIALARGTVCHGSFSPQGSGIETGPIRLTADGQGARPRIVAAPGAPQVLRLFNQQYWQIDSLDLSGAGKYGIFVSGDKGTLRHIYLKNLAVHDLRGGTIKNKDNGLVVVGPSSRDVVFNDILVDGVVAAHTDQWAGILIGGGGYPYAADAPLNSHVTIRNSSVQDVYGDGIVLFRDSDGLIETSTAWETGMQPTESVGTPNAIWTWTCNNCIVRDNEAFLTDSPGVDGGAFDIDYGNTRNTLERNYAHDTQGYCLAVFGSGSATTDSLVRENLCIANGLSPRLAVRQGAVYMTTWNGGVIRGLRIERNTILFDPPVSTASAIMDDAAAGSSSATFTGNHIESAAPLFYRAVAGFAPSVNVYSYTGPGQPAFTLGDRHEVLLSNLQQAGIEKGSTLGQESAPSQPASSLRLEASIDFALDTDGLLAPAPRAQLMVLRSLAAQYGPPALTVTVHLRSPENSSAKEAAEQANALLDLDAPSIHFVRDGKDSATISLLGADGHLIQSWTGFQNAATLGGTVRKLLGAPHFASMRSTSPTEGKP
jgi:hypothetical protein